MITKEIEIKVVGIMDRPLFMVFPNLLKISAYFLGRFLFT